jgi:hypothetical protein
MEKEHDLEKKKSLMDYHQWINWAQKPPSPTKWGFIKKQAKDIAIGSLAFAAANITMYVIVTATIVASAGIYSQKHQNHVPQIVQHVTNSQEAKNLMNDLKDVSGNKLTNTQVKMIQKDIDLLKQTDQINNKISSQANEIYETSFFTPLSYAIKTDNKEVVSMLLDAGANWKANNYEILRNTAHQSDWRNFWIDYFQTNNKDFLPHYRDIMQNNNSDITQASE